MAGEIALMLIIAAFVLAFLGWLAQKFLESNPFR